MKPMSAMRSASSSTRTSIVGERHLAALHEVDEAAGRADDDVDALLERVDLGLEADAAVDGVHAAAAELRQRREDLVHLVGELTGRYEHEAGRPVDEARLARSLDDPRVVTIHDLGEDEGRLFIAMEHMEGGDLAGLLRREGPFDPARTLTLLEPVAKALDAAHAQRLVHGDVKPANILLDDRGDAHVSDLGLAQAPSSRTEVAGQPTFRGTPDYAAPEQIRGESWDPRTDVYALGGVLYECLIGDTPFGDAEGVAVLYAHIEKPAPLPSEANPALAPFDRIIRKALAKEPDDRFQSCATMFVEMRAAASPPPAPTQIAPSAAPAPTRVAPPAPPKPPPTPRIPEVPAFKTPGPTAPPAPEPSWIPTQMRQLLAGGAALSALVLFISLFLSWFEAGGAFSASAASDAGVDITTNAWQTFTGFEAVFVLAALSAVVLAALLMFAPVSSSCSPSPWSPAPWPAPASCWRPRS